jgi:FKBP-type peptidyl-prolyl cis-trans isomerase (trigger factor)
LIARVLVSLGISVTRQEIEQKMDELAREYHETHDPEIPEEIYELARRLKEMEH